MKITDPIGVVLAIIDAIIGLVIALMLAAAQDKRPTDGQLTFMVIACMLLGAAGGGLVYGVLFP